MWVRSLGWDDPLEKEMATHSSMLASVLWTEESGKLQSMGLQRVRHNSARECTCTHTQTHFSPTASKKGTKPSWYLAFTLGRPPSDFYRTIRNLCCFKSLLPSRFSRVRLCETPWTAAYQASPSMGFSRQEHWSGLPFPSPMHESGKWKWSHSVVSDS